jgi:hypothetical protein
MSALSATNVPWPGGKRFAFSIFDDPDSQSPTASRQVYGLLRDLGLRTTKGVWPLAPIRRPSDFGVTCADTDCLTWCLELQRSGFEIGLHNVTSHTSTREETAAGLEEFAQKFGAAPITLAQHYFCEEAVYWGDQRVSDAVRLAYNLVTRFGNRGRFSGHREGDPLFWGDLCRERVRYVRNFVFDEVNTLRACTFFPYHDPARPFVNYWYCSTEGATVKSFVNTLSEANQDRLEQDGGLCIMYAHFGHNFWDGTQLNPRFRQLMERLAKKNGWFAPVSQILDFLRVRNGNHVITDSERGALERRWLLHKLRFGGS